MKSKILLPFVTFSILTFSLLSCTKKETVTGLPPVNTLNDKPVGASAKDLLTSTTYQMLNIEIQYMPGFQPDAAAVNNLKTFLSTILFKPAGISVTLKSISSAHKTMLTLTDISLIEKYNRTVYTKGNQLGVYILYADAPYTDNSTLGIAYRNTSMCLFAKTIHDNSGGLGQVSRTKLESTVLKHELGHNVGLVDLGSPMQTNHKDAAGGHHCNNSNCLMYYAAETTDILGVLLTGNIPDLDANCNADIHANGGR